MYQQKIIDMKDLQHSFSQTKNYIIIMYKDGFNQNVYLASKLQTSNEHGNYSVNTNDYLNMETTPT